MPPARTVSGTLSAAFTLVVTNAGNVNADLSFFGSANPSAAVGLQIDRLSVPAHTTIQQQVSVQAGAGGTYLITAEARGDTVQVADTASLTVNYQEVVPPNLLYLPYIARGP
jgi:hypothetical protein